MRLYFKFFSMHLKSRMAYRASFLFSIVGQFLTSFTTFLGVWFLLKRFETVRGYTLAECALCSGVVLTGFGLSEWFFRGFDRFDQTVRTAAFDRMLLRPRSLMFQVLCDQIEFARVGKILQGALMLAYGIAATKLDWTPARLGLLLLMLLGGAGVFSGLFVLYAALSFFTLEGLECVNVFTYGARDYGAYPLSVYGQGVLRFCTFAIPYALFQYYPLQVLLGRADNALWALLPLATPLWLLPVLALWRLGVRKYRSAGS